MIVYLILGPDRQAAHHVEVLGAARLTRMCDWEPEDTVVISELCPYEGLDRPAKKRLIFVQNRENLDRFLLPGDTFESLGYEGVITSGGFLQRCMAWRGDLPVLKATDENLRTWKFEKVERSTYPHKTCAVGIVTFEREEVLIECLKRVLAGTRLPDEIVVADASEEKADLLQCLPELASVRFVHIETPRGMTRQRNLLLKEVQSEIILFLDDDAYVYPDYVEKMMRVWEADEKEEVGGVEARVIQGELEPRLPIKSFGEKLGRFFRLSLSQKFEEVRQRWIGSELPPEYHQWKHKALEELPVEPVRNLYGCVMSYRAEMAREMGFNELLADYSFLEDFEFSYRIGKSKALLRCMNATAHHILASSGRIPLSDVYFLYHTNIAYIARTLLGQKDDVRRYLLSRAKKYAAAEFVKCCLFGKGDFSPWKGARRGIRATKRIYDAPDGLVDDIYKEVTGQ